jgi:2-amino-4-hydroxy-6-hydroxymethyldihydropteridine diphosphokinase
VISEPDLTIPHPRMAERRFVLVPLAALAPSLSHPLLKVTATELLRRLGPEPIGLLEQRQ